jgi:thiol:disulfide interchange protein DsbC
MFSIGGTMKRAIFSVLAAIAILPAVAGPAAAFKDGRSAGGACTDCHTLTREEAESALRGMVDNVTGVVPGPFPGVWEVDAAKGGKIYPLYMDYSRKYLFQGQFIRLSDRQNVTGLRYADLNRVDVSSISLKDAIVMGNRSSKKRIIVLSDPTCPYCVKLHGEIKKAVGKDPGVAFYVMPYPRNRNDKATYRKCLAAVCGKSEKLLDDAYEGKELPAPSCQSDAVNETMKLAERLQIQGTPSMILPDGRIIGGYMEADALLSLFR